MTSFTLLNLCKIQPLRSFVDEQLELVGEEIVLRVLEKQKDLSEMEVKVFARVFVKERLSAAAELIWKLYQRELDQLQAQLERQRHLLDAVLNPYVKLHRADQKIKSSPLPAQTISIKQEPEDGPESDFNFLHNTVCKEESPPEQQERSSNVVKQESTPPQDWRPSLVEEESIPPQIKEKPDKLPVRPEEPGTTGKGAASFDEVDQNRRTMSSSMNALKEITTMAGRLNLPRNIIARTNNLFKQVYDHKSLKVRSNHAIASACLYIACRQEGVPRTFKEICAVSRLSKKEIGRCFKLILKTLETSVDLITTGDFMSRFCSSLGLPERVQMAATFIAGKVEELDLVPGRSPVSVVAVAIYMASQASAERKTPNEIGDIAGVAEVTIRQLYRLIYPRAAELFPPDMPVYRLPQL